MRQVRMTIDGREVKVAKQTTLLQAAKSVGIEIPTLCHDDRLSSYGACRLCSVEIVKNKKSKIVASCVYPAEEGLIVKTQSPRVKKIRKVLLELLQASSPRGQIEELGRAYDTDPSKLEKELTFCILCGLCVRYCKEVAKKNALGFVGRGVERQVVFFPDIAVKECPTCEGECFSLCPTGIIPNRFAVSIPRFGEKFPTVFPVRLSDTENILRLSKEIK